MFVNPETRNACDLHQFHHQLARRMFTKDPSSPSKHDVNIYNTQCVKKSVHRGEGCAWQGGMHWGHAWQERQPLQWTVRILLECILVQCISRLQTNQQYVSRGILTSTQEILFKECGSPVVKSYGVFTLAETDTDSYNMQKRYTRTDTDSDSDVK